MSAFTYLGQTVDLSVAHNAITLYPKKTRELQLFPYDFSALGGFPESIYRDDPDHHYVHDDKFNIDRNHYHLKFSFHITQDKFADILSVLIRRNLITPAEKDNMLKVYIEVNQQAIEQFWDKLANIQKKAVELTNYAKDDPDTYALAAEKATSLYKKLKKEGKDYINNSNKTPQCYDLFQKNCNAAIEEARGTLEEHRGCKKILANIAAAIIGLGVFYLVAATINYYKTNGQHFFFNFKTDSSQKLHEFKEAQLGVLRI